MESQDKVIRVIRLTTALVKKTIDSKWTFPSGRYGNAVIEDGLKRMKVLVPFGKLYDGIIVDFIVYQIYYYRDNISADKRWKITWCFSKKAVERYQRQFQSKNGKAGMRYYIDRWLSDYRISRDELSAMLTPQQHSLQRFVYMESEENVKKRFLNTEFGLMNCNMATTGWSPKSKACQACNDKEKCITITRRKFPELVRLRENNHEEE